MTMHTCSQPIPTQSARLVSSQGASLGESPLWDETMSMLRWVDIKQGILFEYSEKVERVLSRVDGPLSAIAAVEAGGLLLAVGGQLQLISCDGSDIRQWSEWPGCSEDFRFNDGKVDPLGRFWVGSMSVDAKPGEGVLLRVDRNGEWVSMLEGLTIPNGLAWSADASRFYFIDSPTREIWEFSFDLESGDLSNKRVAVRVPDSMGVPDGMAIDAQGHLWVAHWGDGAVRCWDPQTGRLLSMITTEDALTTSCCFGGDACDQIYITTASGENSKGRLFTAPVGVRGGKSYAFKL